MRALERRVNLVDPSRQSKSYCLRLIKYAKRGFAIGVPGFERASVNPSIFLHAAHHLQGLARLLVVEVLMQQGAPSSTVAGCSCNFNPRSVGGSNYRAALCPRHRCALALWVQAPRDTRVPASICAIDNRDRLLEEEELTSVDGCDYQSTFIPVGPRWNLSEIEALLNTRQRVLREREMPLPFYHSADVGDVLALPVEDTTLPRLLDEAWLTQNPGTQLTGSFQPTADQDFWAGAFGAEGEVEEDAALRRCSLVAELQSLRVESATVQSTLCRVRARFEEISKDAPLDTDAEWTKFDSDCSELSAVEAAAQDIEARERMRSALMCSGWTLADKCSASLQLGLVRLRELQELVVGFPAGGSLAASRDAPAAEQTLWELLAPSKDHTVQAMAAAHALKAETTQLRCDIERATFAGEPSASVLLQRLPVLLKDCNAAEAEFSVALRKERDVLSRYVATNKQALSLLLAEIEARIKALQRLIRRESNWMEIASETSKALALTLEAGKRRTHALDLVETTSKALRDAKLKLERVAIDAKLQPHHTVTDGPCSECEEARAQVRCNTLIRFSLLLMIKFFYFLAL
jgi:hypothetical protein